MHVCILAFCNFSTILPATGNGEGGGGGGVTCHGLISNIIALTSIGRWFGLGGDNNESYKYKFDSLQTCFLNFRLDQKSRRAKAPFPPASYPFGPSVPLLSNVVQGFF